MHVDDRMPLLVGHFLNNAVPRVAGVIDNNVQPAKIFDRRCHELIRKAAIRNRARTDRRLPAKLFDRGRGFLGRTCIQIVHHDPRPFRGEL